MNNLKNIFITTLTLALCFISCGKEDICSMTDWRGNFSGSQTCLGVTKDVKVTVDTDIQTLIITIDDSERVINVTPVSVGDCSFTSSYRQDGFTVDIDGSLDGSSLKMTSSIQTQQVGETTLEGGLCSYNISKS